jgi:hypothetical protein
MLNLTIKIPKIAEITSTAIKAINLTKVVNQTEIETVHLVPF